MRLRSAARWCAFAGLTLAMFVAAPASSSTYRIPSCLPGPAPTRPPDRPAGLLTPQACHATPSQATESSFRADRLRGVAGAGGYRHLGAGTLGEWGGVSGRISVVNAPVRSGTYDFVAGRFMVKRDMGQGRIAWLEAGWTEAGWAGTDRQRIYTFDTNTKAWRFYDEYPIKPGDRVWVDIRLDPDGLWRAWLWWNNRWNLLSAQRLPIGSSGYVEQYVELYADPRRPARIGLPAVAVDNVRLHAPAGGTSRYWRDDVATGAAAGIPGAYCVSWITRYDTWIAGDCELG